jgi:hypothetical protein
MVIGSSDFVIAYTQPSAIAPGFSVITAARRHYGKRKVIADSGEDQHCEAATTGRGFWFIQD